MRCDYQRTTISQPLGCWGTNTEESQRKFLLTFRFFINNITIAQCPVFFGKKKVFICPYNIAITGKCSLRMTACQGLTAFSVLSGQ